MIINAVTNFVKGVVLPLRGLKLFVRQPRYWHYLALPVIINCLIYIVGIWLAVVYLWPVMLKILPQSAPGSWNDLWYYPLHLLIDIFFFLVTACIAVVSFTMLFFIVAAPFLDNLTLLIERENYQLEFSLSGKRDFLYYCWRSFVHNLRLGLIMLLWTIILIPLGWLVPGLGMLPFIIVISYYFAISFLLYSAEHYNISSRQLNCLLKGKKMLALGFGLVAYFALLLPFVAIPLLPIMVVAGVIMFNEELLPDQRKPHGISEMPDGQKRAIRGTAGEGDTR